MTRLADCFTGARLAEDPAPWRPYPPAADRPYWGRVPRETREHLLSQAAPYSERPWPVAAALHGGGLGAGGNAESPVTRRHRPGGVFS